MIERLTTKLHGELVASNQDAIHGRHRDQQITMHDADPKLVTGPTIAPTRIGSVGLHPGSGELRSTPLTNDYGEQITMDDGSPIMADSEITEPSGPEGLIEPAGPSSELQPKSAATGVASIADSLSVADRIDVTITPFRLPTVWEMERQEALRLLGELRQAIREAEPALSLAEELRRFGVGGNFPPEDIDASSSADEIITDAKIANDVLGPVDKPPLVPARPERLGPRETEVSTGVRT